jgi:GNAT superfamily N-acetyltransferase
MLGLPDFFGHEGGLAQYRKDVRSQEGWAAEDDGAVVGFATWASRTDATAEITWMAVRRDRRHSGVGTAIIEAAVNDLRARGFKLALAMTSAGPKDKAIEDTYVPTRQFWTSRGFLPLIELDLWEEDRALLQVRPLS